MTQSSPPSCMFYINKTKKKKKCLAGFNMGLTRSLFSNWTSLPFEGNPIHHLLFNNLVNKTDCTRALCGHFTCLFEKECDTPCFDLFFASLILESKNSKLLWVRS